MQEVCIGNLEIVIRKTFFQRLGGAITRPIARNEAMVFIPGASIHTLFMSQSIDVIFANKNWKVLKVHQNIRPWKLVFAPIGTYFTIETQAFVAKSNNIQQGDVLK